MPSPAQRDVLAWARGANTDELVNAFMAAREGHHNTVEAAMEDRWTAMAALGELFRRGEAERVPFNSVRER